MNKPVAKGELIPVREFAKTMLSRRGFPVSVQYIYKLIDKHKKEGKQLSFQFEERGKGIWIRR